MEHRHFFRLSPETCLQMFQQLELIWTPEQYRRIVRCVLRDCDIGRLLAQHECIYGCCKCGVNVNILAFMKYIGEDALVSSHADRTVHRKTVRACRVDFDDEEDDDDGSSAFDTLDEPDDKILSNLDSDDSQGATAPIQAERGAPKICEHLEHEE
jgi:hypothetical protein